MDDAIKAAIRVAEDYMERLREAEEEVEHWREIAGREALRAKDLERRALVVENQPNGSDVQ